jgi:hypothetical protein
MTHTVNPITVEDNTCGMCRYSYRISENDWECRLNPPILDGDYAGSMDARNYDAWVWPVIRHTDTCGQYISIAG